MTALLRSARLPTDDLASASDLHLWVLDAEGDIVGAIGIERFGTTSMLRSLIIAPAYQRRGLGHRLVAQLEQEVQCKGVQQLVLLTETAESIMNRLGIGQFHGCSAAGEVCPVWPGRTMTAHWDLPDPAAVEGSDVAKMTAFRQAFRAVATRITLFLSLPLTSLDPLRLNERLDAIGRTPDRDSNAE